MQVLDHSLTIICESTGNRARDQADLQERIRAFELVLVNGTAYCLHVATHCLAFIEGVRILIIK